MHQTLASPRKKPRQVSPKRWVTSSTAHASLVLEFVAPASVEALNAFYRRGVSAELAIAGETMTIAPIWPPLGSGKYPSSTIAFSMGDAEGELHMPRALVERWLLQGDPEADLSRLIPGHAGLLLESFLSEELAWLEERLECQIVVKAVRAHDAASGAGPFVFALTGKEGAVTCDFHLDDADCATRLGRLLEGSTRTRQHLRFDIPVPVRLWRGAVTVTVGELQSLQAGDVVLLDDIEGEAAGALTTVGGQFVAPVEFTNEGARLIDRLCHFAGSKWGWMMNHNTNLDAAHALEDSDLENLPVTLVFELGRTALPLGEVKQLAPGSIVPLGELTNEVVDVTANGKRVGRGEIVRIGESLGVRLVRMFDNA